MKIFGRELVWRRPEQRALDTWWLSPGEGELLNGRDPMRLAEWSTGIALISEAVGGAPRGVVRVDAAGDVEAVPDHPTGVMLRTWAHPGQPAADEIERLHCDLILEGTAWAWVERAGAGGPAVGLERIPPREVRRRNGDYYAEDRLLTPANSLRVGSLRGIREAARDDLKLANLVRGFASRFFLQGGAPSGAIEVPTMVGPENVQRLAEEASGTSKAHKVIVLQGGMKWRTVGSNASEAQLLEAADAGVRTAARWLGISPILLGDTSRASYSTAEHARLDFLGQTLRPAVRRWDRAMSLGLLTSAEVAAGLQVRTDLRDVVLGDRASRASYFAAGTGGRGWLTPNDVRRQEGLPPVDDESAFGARPSGGPDPLYVPGTGSAE